MIQLKSLKAKGIKKLDIPSDDSKDEKLEFPEKGEILVHGSNESGKSTMFESIYFALFGTALVPDRSTSSMSQLLNYGKDKGMVELEFKVDETIYTVKRVIKQNTRMSYKHQLKIQRPGQEPAEFRGKGNVNEQIQEELGLDGDSLLNSCFVQQKNLDRLESRDKSEREDSISTLLNLDKFTELENDYSSQLSDLEQKVENKDIQLQISKLVKEQIPNTNDKLSRVEDKLEIITKESEIEENETKIDEELKEKLEEIQEKEEKLPIKEKLLDHLENLFESLKEKENIEEKEKSLDDIEDNIEEAQEKLEDIEDTLPDKKNLKDLLIDLNEKQEDLEEWKEREDKLDELEKEIRALKEDNKDLNKKIEEKLIPKKEKYEKALKNRKYINSLNDWQRLEKAANQQEKIQSRKEELKENKSGKKSEKETAENELHKEERKRNIGSAGGLIIGAISGVGIILTPMAGIGVVAGMLIAAYFWMTASVEEYRDKKKSLDEDLDSIENNLTELQGKEKLSKDIDSEEAVKELEEVENEIKGLDRKVPDSIEEAEKIETEVINEIENDMSISKLEEKNQEVQEDITEAETTVNGNEEEIEDELKEEKKDYSREKINDRLDELEDLISTKKQEASELADNLDKNISVDPEEEDFEDIVNTVRSEFTSANTSKQDLEKEIDDLKEDKQEYDRDSIEEKIDNLEEEISSQYEASISRIDALEKDIDLEENHEEVNSIKSALNNEIEQDKDEISQKEEIEEKIDNLEEEIEGLEERIGELEYELDINDIDESESELEEEKSSLTEQLGGLKKKKQELEKEIDYQDVDIETAEEELDDSRENKLEIEYSENIVSTAKHRIMDQILPKTESNMARFLPILTNGEYKVVNIDSESYDVKVHDNEADEMKDKAVFSGGTRDQFSLALRLSFAMATLPQERGSAPDFLFLDEPIGAFDQTRKESLMELLTRGEIAENFSQIFVISHIDDLKNEFDQHIKMEDGRIKQKKLEA